MRNILEVKSYETTDGVVHNSLEVATDYQKRLDAFAIFEVWTEDLPSSHKDIVMNFLVDNVINILNIQETIKLI